MNSDLIIFLEESGFICSGPWHFKKNSSHEIAKKIEIVGYGWGYNDEENPKEYNIDVYSNDGTSSEDSLIIWIKICNFYCFDLKIKRIINYINEIITVSSIFNGCADFTDSNENPDSMIISSYEGISIDLSEDEPKVMNSRPIK